MQSIRAAIRTAGSAFLLGALALAFGPNAYAAETAQGGNIVVTGVKGDVHVTMRGETRAVRQGTVVQLAASVRTGKDGSLQLRQGNTSFNVAADSVIELPAGAALGDPIDRVLQPKGNVFYDVGKRGPRKLRVETPYLVAVIKGTQFNVAVQDDSSVISLFEGLLEVRASDGSDVVDLHAGEIAIRGRGDASIRVITMDKGTPVARADSRQVPAGKEASDSSNNAGSTSRSPTAPVETELARVSPQAGAGGTGANGSVSVSTGKTPTVTASSAISLDDKGGGLAADIDLRAADKAAATIGLNVGAGAVNLGIGTDVAVDLGAGSVDVGVNTAVDLGAASVDVGVNTAVDLGAGAVAVGLDAGVDLGGVAAVDVGVDAGVDLGAGAVDVGVAAGVDLGAAAIDLGADVGVDLGAAAIDASVDAGVAGLDAGVGLGADLSAGTVAVDVGVVGLDLGLDVDLGAGTIDLGVGTVTPTVPGTPTGGTTPGAGGGGLLGGIVGGLLGRGR